MKKKKKASAAMGYTMLFTMALLMVILTFYMMAAAKLMTIRRDVDDALADSVLAALVADDVYYFETLEASGTPVVRYRNIPESYQIYRQSMRNDIEGEDAFYSNISYPAMIFYEVENGMVRITKYNSSGGRSVSTGTLGYVKTPSGETVKETSAYGKVNFDLKSLIGGSPYHKSREIYCTLEVNDLHGLMDRR